MNQDQPVTRTPLLTVDLGSREITTVEIHSIRMAPGQMAGLHLHPCPVTGYIVSGTAVYQLEGEEPRILQAGAAFYEPVDTRVAQFGNHSESEPMEFVAFYLVNGRQELIRML